MKDMFKYLQLDVRHLYLEVSVEVAAAFQANMYRISSSVGWGFFWNFPPPLTILETWDNPMKMMGSVFRDSNILNYHMESTALMCADGS